MKLSFIDKTMIEIHNQSKCIGQVIVVRSIGNDTFKTECLHLSLENHLRNGSRRIIKARETEFLLRNCVFYR